jgi:toxin YoeB
MHHLLSFDPEGWEDYIYWQKTDKIILKKINILIQEIIRTPFFGIGKPEPLKHDFNGFWSRRINDEHRLIYRALDHQVVIVQCRYHY